MLFRVGRCCRFINIALPLDIDGFIYRGRDQGSWSSHPCSDLTMSFLAALNSYKKAASSEQGAAELTKKKDSSTPPYKHPHHETLMQIKADGVEQTGSEEAVARESQCGLTLLFIIVDSFPHEAIWRSWLDHASQTSREKVRVLFHAKFPNKVTSPWVKRHLCKTFQLSPSWGSLELTEVMVRLLEESMQRELDIPTIGALPNYLEGSVTETETETGGKKKEEDPPSSEDQKQDLEEQKRVVLSSHFVFASESCLPIRSVDEAFQEIEQSRVNSQIDSSWLYYTDKATNGYAQQLQFDKLQGVIPQDCIFKADQWILLSRQHAQQVISLPALIEKKLEGRVAKVEGQTSAEDGGKEKEAAPGGGGGRYRNKMLQLFKKTRASDEIYFPCSLGVLNMLSMASGAEGGETASTVKKRQVTHCDWSDGGKNPREYRALPALFSGDGEETVKGSNPTESAKAQGCLFLRKVVYPREAGVTGRGLAEERRAFHDAWKTCVLAAPAPAPEGEKAEAGEDASKDHFSLIEEEHRWFKVEQDRQRREREDLKRKRQDQQQYGKERDRDRDTGHNYNNYNYNANQYGDGNGYGDYRGGGYYQGGRGYHQGGRGARGNYNNHRHGRAGDRDDRGSGGYGGNKRYRN